MVGVFVGDGGEYRGRRGDRAPGAFRGKSVLRVAPWCLIIVCGVGVGRPRCDWVSRLVWSRSLNFRTSHSLCAIPVVAVAVPVLLWKDGVHALSLSSSCYSHDCPSALRRSDRYETTHHQNSTSRPRRCLTHSCAVLSPGSCRRTPVARKACPGWTTPNARGAALVERCGLCNFS